MGSKKKVIGTCNLCLKTEQLLVRGHFIPAFAHGAMLADGPAVQISKSGTKRFSEWFVSPVFCSSCENDHINKKGEQYVAKVAYRGGSSFPLEEHLKRYNRECERSLKRPTLRSYDVSGIDEINSEALIYFALSIVYRAYVWARIGSYASDLIITPHEVSEELRRFLLGLGPIPASTMVQAIVIGKPVPGPHPDFRKVMVLPYRRAKDLSQELEWQPYQPIEFCLAGFCFHVVVGDYFPEIVARDSLLPGQRLFRAPSNELHGLLERSVKAVELASRMMIWTPPGVFP